MKSKLVQEKLNRKKIYLEESRSQCQKKNMGKPKMDLIPEPKPEKKFQQLRLTFSPAAQKAIDDFRESRGYSVQNGKIILNSKKKTTSTVQTQTAGCKFYIVIIKKETTICLKIFSYFCLCWS